MKFKKIDINKILIFFLFSHLVVWTLVPSISNTNLPLDVIEAIVWSDGWPLGWEKHPPLSSWFPGIFFQIFPPSNNAPNTQNNNQNPHHKFVINSKNITPILR